MRSDPKYDKYGRPTDGTNKNWRVTRPHGRGDFNYATEKEADESALRLVAEYNEPVRVWRAVAEYDRATPPIERRAL